MAEPVGMREQGASRDVSVRRLPFHGPAEQVRRAVPVEAPIAIVYGTVPFAVMMASPADIEDFVLGFSLTEGVIEAARDVREVTLLSDGLGVRAEISLVPERMSRHLARKRSLSGRTGCGLCGVEDMADLPVSAPLAPRAPAVSLPAIERAVHELEHHQPLNDLTRAVHGAAWFGLEGGFRTLREDVGRHNALDKLIGALLRAGIDPETGFIVITSRCSYEMVEKAAAFGARLIVAVSAPTELAVRRAETIGITLVAVARRDGAMLFCGSLAGERSAPGSKALRSETTA